MTILGAAKQSPLARGTSTRKAVILALSFLAYWPVWVWYLRRLVDRSDEPLGIVALVTFIILVLNVKKDSACPRVKPENQYSAASPENNFDASPGINASMHDSSFRSMKAEDSSLHANPSAVQESRLDDNYLLLFSILTLTAYLFLGTRVSMLFNGVFAVTAIGLATRYFGVKGRLHIGDWLLLYLSLPLVASLNFYLGYPLRLIVTHMASCLLSVAGTPVVQQGTMLIRDGAFVQIDAPCSGIKMLWLSLYLVALFGSYLKLSTIDFLKLLVLSAIAAILANVLRVTSLFYVEADLLKLPSSFLGDNVGTFSHDGIGLISFALLVLLISMSALYIWKSSSGKTKRDRPADSLLFAPYDSSGATFANRAQSGSRLILSNSRDPVPAFAGLNLMVLPAITCGLCVLAIASGFLPRDVSEGGKTVAFKGFPRRLLGESYRPLPMPPEKEASFKAFPGKVQA
ncbi:MAG: exosortase/archaeosortase family protein, partial [Cyanobacteria bacterium]|nr:exosortase/archaeosortase family protein [Cyanobacteriota bacterium]